MLLEKGLCTITYTKSCFASLIAMLLEERVQVHAAAEAYLRVKGGESMEDDFEVYLNVYRPVVERFVKFRLPTLEDAEDVLQDVYVTAYLKFDTLREKSLFKPWILAIARNKCNDYFRVCARMLEIPVEEMNETILSYNKHGVAEMPAVHEALEKLGGKDKQILYLYYFENLPQAEIAERLNIPLGTVKSRLYTAKMNFKANYLYDRKEKERLL